MAKEEITYVGIKFDNQDLVYAQRLEPTLASEQPLTQSEQIILQQYRYNKALLKEVEELKGALQWDDINIKAAENVFKDKEEEITNLKKELEESKKENKEAYACGFREGEQNGYSSYQEGR